MGLSMNTRSADSSADRIDVITNFAVITNVVIKRFPVPLWSNEE